MALACIVPDCDYISPTAAKPAAAVQAFADHMACHPVQIPSTREPSVRPPALSRPSIDLGCTSAQWYDFLDRWSRFCIDSNVTDEQRAPQCRACLTVQLADAVSHVGRDVSALTIDVLLARVKTVAVNPPIGIRRAIAKSSKQGAGEQFTAFAERASVLMIGCDYVDPCPQAPVSPEDEEQVLACSIVGCAGADFTTSILRTILLAGIYDSDIRRSILGTIGIERKPVQEVINLVEMKEAARLNCSSLRLPFACIFASVLILQVTNAFSLHYTEYSAFLSLRIAAKNVSASLAKKERHLIRPQLVRQNKILLHAQYFKWDFFHHLRRASNVHQRWPTP